MGRTRPASTERHLTSASSPIIAASFAPVGRPARGRHVPGLLPLRPVDAAALYVQWTLRPDGEIAGLQSGRCLDDPAFSTTNGTQLHIWSCNDGTSQRWKLP